MRKKSKKVQEEEVEEEVVLSASEEESSDSDGQNRKRKSKGGESDSSSKKAKMEEERSSENTVFVNNIPRNMNLEEFQQLFPDASHIRFPTKYDQTSKGFAFLVFDTEKEMEKCLKKKQGIEINNKKLQLTMAGNSKTLYIKNINKNVSEEELCKIFPDCTSIRYPEYDDGKHKGYAYLQFSTENKVKEVITKKQGMYLKGEKLFLELAKQREQNHSGQKFRSSFEIKKDGYSVSEEPTKSVTVRNLTFNISEDDIIKEFGALKGRLIKDEETGQSKGRAYLLFKTKKDAEEAVSKFNEEKLHDRRIYLYYTSKLGKNKKERPKKENPNSRKNKRKQKLKEDYED
ncbi:hypothetical protein LOTGIDRAFT_229266 [Lottia gigantea]|uniref:RRM domain-containing protein n=1 Tax=Lottia gigantea TaxID=225164 RepID=V3Z8B0_LOTGI|nr:hypothetical protein LOTGIDRAFT_229266 [Lottia gigantea]ESO87108.1 hypothetical protein LOTGIDRAFT_229266 [Lottia gigantea]